MEERIHAQGQRGVSGGLVTDTSVRRKLTPKLAVGEGNSQKQADSCCRVAGGYQVPLKMRMWGNAENRRIS